MTTTGELKFKGPNAERILNPQISKSLDTFGIHFADSDAHRFESQRDPRAFPNRPIRDVLYVMGTGRSGEGKGAIVIFEISPKTHKKNGLYKVLVPFGESYRSVEEYYFNNDHLCYAATRRNGNILFPFDKEFCDQKLLDELYSGKSDAVGEEKKFKKSLTALLSEQDRKEIEDDENVALLRKARKTVIEKALKGTEKLEGTKKRKAELAILRKTNVQSLRDAEGKARAEKMASILKKKQKGK